VFEGVLAPGPEPIAPAEPSPAATGEPAAPAPAEAIDCATACVNGCLRPEACPSAAARAAVAALLEERSLDELVTIASDSFESRTRARFERDAGFPL
jgi:diaminopimelate epimerase